MVGVGLLLLILVLLLTVSISPVSFTETAEQTAIVSTVVLICIALFPVFLCLLLVYAGILVALYYTGRANRKAAALLRQTHVTSRDVVDRATTAADRASQWSIRINSMFARLNPLLTRFDRPEKQDHNQKGDSNDQ